MITLRFTINDNIKIHGATVEIIEAQQAKLCTTCKNTKLKGAFIVHLNVNFNILKQFNCALVGQIKDLITSKCAVHL
jgi:hypothetical protein